MHKTTRKSVRNGRARGKQAEPSVDNSTESSLAVLEPRRSFWKSFSSIFKCTTKRRPIPADSEENEQANILPVQSLPPVMEAASESNVDTASAREDICDMKTMLKKYSISPNSISMVQRLDGSKNVSKQSSLTGYVTDVSASSSDEEESVRKKVLLKNKINEFKQEIIREESNVRAEKLEENEKTTMKKSDRIACSSSMLTVDKDTYSFDYSESSQQSVADGNEEKQEKVMFDNNIKVKDENDIVTVDSINDASHPIKENTDDEDTEEHVNYDQLEHEEKVALIEEQYSIALSTVNKIEEQLTVYSKHLDCTRSTDDITGQSLEFSELENRDAMQNAMKVFGTKIMDNQGSNLLRHLHDMHQKHPATIQSDALSLDESAAKTKPMNMQLEYCRKFGYPFPCFTARLNDNDEETQDNATSSSESLNEVEVWSKDLNNVIKYVDRRDLPIFSAFKHCPVNEDGYKMLRLNSLFVAVAHPVTLKYRVVYDPIENSDVPRQLQHDDDDDASNLVTHKPKHMSLVVQHDAMYEEDSLESADKQSDRYYTNEEKWESGTNETESFTPDNDANVTDDEDSDWKTVDLEEIDVSSLTNTEDSHEEYVNQQNRYNLMSTLPRSSTKRASPPVEFKVTMRNPDQVNVVREYVAYRNETNLVDKSTSYSSLPAMELLYKNQNARSEESTSVTTARTDDNNEISLTFRNINEDVEHMINDLLIDVSEVKDGCMQITEGMCDEPMVELKRTSNGVIRCIDTSSRISEALAQTIIHEILEDVFYYSEEHVPSEAAVDDGDDAEEMLHCEHDIGDAELADQEECEDTLEGAYTYMRKDDRSKVFSNLDEVMQDLAQDTTTVDQNKMNTAVDSYEYCACPPSMEDMQRAHDEKMRLLQVQSILQHMLQREANKRQNKDVLQQNRRANVDRSGYNDSHSPVRKSSGGIPKYTSCEADLNERKELLTGSVRPECNYHRFFNNNFSIKNGFIGTPHDAMYNTCSNLAGKECRGADSGLESGRFKATDDTARDSDLLRYAEKQQRAKLQNPVCRKSQNYPNIELPKYSRTIPRKNRLMVDKSTGNEQETQPVSSKRDSSLDKNAVEQNIEENLWSFEEAMRNLIRVNKKTAKLLKSSCVFSPKPSGADKSVDEACCSSERTAKRTKKLQSKNASQRSVTKDLTAADQSSLTERDQSLTKSNQHLSDNLEKILLNFSQQFSDCITPEKSNVQ